MHNIFNAEKAKEICGMVVCPWSRIDKMVWASTKDGEFTEESIKGEESFLNIHHMRLLWKGIWNIKGKRVVKTFLY